MVLKTKERTINPLDQGLLYHTELDGTGHTIPYQFNTNIWYGGHTDTQYTKPVPYQHNSRLALAWGSVSRRQTLL